MDENKFVFIYFFSHVLILTLSVEILSLIKEAVHIYLFDYIIFSQQMKIMSIPV